MTSTLEIPGYVAGTWDIDPVHSEVGFVVRHLVVTKVRGRFADVKGHIVTGENPLDSAGGIEGDLDCISTHNAARARRGWRAGARGRGLGRGSRGGGGRRGGRGGRRRLNLQVQRVGPPVQVKLMV